MLDRMLQQSKVPLYCIITCGESCIEGMYYYGFIASVIFAVISTLVAAYNIVMHFINFNNPYFQSKIIIILLLPPIFSFTSSFSFLSFTITTYLAIGRTVYELFAVFAFFFLIFAYLGFDYQKNQVDERKVYDIMRGETSEVPHDFPCSYFQKPYQISNWRKAKYLSYRCKRVVLQYIIAKIIASVLVMIFQTAAGWDYNIPPYIQNGVYWIITLSSYLGYYYLIIFYNCLKKPLKPFKLELKFFVITSTIFFIFWQTVVFAIFDNDIIACFDKSAKSFQRNKILHEFEHILICIEMLFIVFICVQAFSYEAYEVKSKRKVGSIPFIIKDIVALFFTELRLIKPKTFGFSSNNDKSEAELQTITSSIKSNSKMCYNYNIKAQIAAAIQHNYF